MQYARYCRRARRVTVEGTGRPSNRFLGTEVFACWGRIPLDLSAVVRRVCSLGYGLHSVFFGIRGTGLAGAMPATFLKETCHGLGGDKLNVAGLSVQTKTRGVERIFA